MFLSGVTPDSAWGHNLLWAATAQLDVPKNELLRIVLDSVPGIVHGGHLGVILGIIRAIVCAICVWHVVLQSCIMCV